MRISEFEQHLEHASWLRKGGKSSYSFSCPQWRQSFASSFTIWERQATYQVRHSGNFLVEEKYTVRVTELELKGITWLSLWKNSWIKFCRGQLHSPLSVRPKLTGHRGHHCGPWLFVCNTTKIAAYMQVEKQLREAGVKYSLIHPAKLWFVFNMTRHKFVTPLLQHLSTVLTGANALKGEWHLLIQMRSLVCLSQFKLLIYRAWCMVEI